MAGVAVSGTGTHMRDRELTFVLIFLTGGGVTCAGSTLSARAKAAAVSAAPVAAFLGACRCGKCGRYIAASHGHC